MKFVRNLLIFVLAIYTVTCLKSHQNNDQTDVILRSYMNKPTKEIFKVYHFLFKKDYELNSEEGIIRYKAFKDNLKWIKENNALEGREVYGITPFTDLTNQEYQERHLVKGLKPFADYEKPTGKLASNEKYRGNSEIDWRPLLNKVKDQKTCGSCWAFSAITTIEGNYNIKFGTLFDLSEQFFVECSSTNYGCNGGFPDAVMKWAIGNGVKLQNDVPYKNSQRYCSKNMLNGTKNIVKDYSFCTNCSQDQFLNLIKEGPILVIMDAGEKTFQNYKPLNDRDPWIPKSCNSQSNHAITAVGITIINGKEHVIVRNSWGTKWGIDGNFIVPIDNSCNIAQNGWLPIVQEDANKPFPEPTCSSFWNECDFNGKQYNTCWGFTQASQTQLGAPVQSFKIVSSEFSYKWVGFKDEKCTGKANIMGTDTKCFPKNYQRTSFASVATSSNHRSRCANLYSEPCFTGEYIYLCDSIANLQDEKDLKWDIKSINLNDYSLWGIVFFPQPDFKGMGYFFPAVNIYNIDENPELATAIKNAKSVKIFPKKS